MSHPLTRFLVEAHGGIIRQVVAIANDIPNNFHVVAPHQEMCGLRVVVTERAPGIAWRVFLSHIVSCGGLIVHYKPCKKYAFRICACFPNVCCWEGSEGPLELTVI
jgi:hypothetical protein